MDEVKNLKAYCPKTKRHFGLELKQFGGEWKVVNMVDISAETANKVESEIRQPRFLTNENLLPCQKCGGRVVGGCSCSRKIHNCDKKMSYCFDCIYCDQFEIDYTPATGSAGAQDGVTVEGNVRFKPVTFSNVEWKKFDCLKSHPIASEFPEVQEHVVIRGKDISFYGYHVSEMNEGVYYTIGGNDYFEIECDIDTSTIKPHPGGFFYIECGALTAQIGENGGSFLFNGNKIGSVGSRFRMKLSVANGNRYDVIVDGNRIGCYEAGNGGKIKIKFGFSHGRHFCELRSDAMISNIRMRHGQQMS